jgi:hypothetical protein
MLNFRTSDASELGSLRQVVAKNEVVLVNELPNTLFKLLPSTSGSRS